MKPPAMRNLILQEEAYRRNMIIAVYLLSDFDGDILKKVMAMASEQSTGTWISVPGIDQDDIAGHAGQIVSIWEIPDVETSAGGHDSCSRYIIQLGFPAANFRPQIPMLFTTVFGNISLIGDVRLLDIIFPRSFTDAMPGPRFGISGIRNLLGIPKRPLLNTMIKPSIGITPEQGAELLYQALIGGADIIKDDEVLSDNDVSPRFRRLESYQKKLHLAENETGEKKLYAVNVTGDADDCIRSAEKAVAEGAIGIMVNFLTAGFGVISALARNPAVKVPILAHLDFGGALCAGSKNGISSSLIYGKLARLAGVDLLTIPTPYGKFDLNYRSYSAIITGLRGQLYDVNPVFPIIGGGITPGMLPVLHSFLGTDYIVGAGGAVYGHPMGASAGAAAFRQGISLLMEGKTIAHSSETEELAKAIDAWGIEGE